MDRISRQCNFEPVGAEFWRLLTKASDMEQHLKYYQSRTRKASVRDPKDCGQLVAYQVMTPSQVPPRTIAIARGLT